MIKLPLVGLNQLRSSFGEIGMEQVNQLSVLQLKAQPFCADHS